MIVRTWQTMIDPDRVDDFESFANTHSLPMFRQQPGCLGVFLSRAGADSTTFSFWEDREVIDRLVSSPSYQDTVRRIQKAGLLRGEQIVTIFPIFGGYLDLEKVEGQLR